jgi:8-amino-7-oxononanoate synthase
VDLFKKAYDFTRADDVKAAGYYPYFHAFDANEGPVVHLNGRKIIMAGSNNYLGLTIDPRVKEAAIKAINQYGTGCSGSRYLTGTIKLHNQMEEELADFLGKPACLLFSTGYQTAQGVIPTLCQRGDYVISDKDNHACIVAGNLMAKGMFGEVVRYNHNDMADLERRLSKIPIDAGKLIVTDGIFSTTGEMVDLPHIVGLAKKYNARVMSDDAHATGVVGEGGRGVASHYGIVDECDLTMGTFSKTFASLGGFVVGDAKVIDFIKHTSPALIFSASPAPASVAAALKALQILREEPELMTHLIDNANYMRKGFKDLGFKIIENQSAIVPVIVGDDIKAFVFWRKLFDAGVFVNAFISPGVPEGNQMMRTSYMAVHKKEHLDRILELFKEIGEEVGVLDTEDESPAIDAGMTRANVEYKLHGKIKIVEAESRKEKLRFLRMVWDLYANEPNWVPPLEMDKMRLIDEKRNPFYKHAEAKFFIAEDNGVPIGRIAAIINKSHNNIYKDRVGFFGFFECVNNQEVADALFKKAEDWLSSKGMKSVRGPISPSINDEVGMLVDGFQYPAAFMMPYHLPFYKSLVEHAGYFKVEDMLAWRLDAEKTLTPKLKRVTDLMRERGGITIRNLDMKNFDRDVKLIKELYARGWEDNWGAVPLDDSEIDMLAGELKQVIEPEYVLFAEKQKDGKTETIGFTLTLPDINQAFKAGNPIPKGTMNLPKAIMNLMTHKNKIDSLRIILLGVMPEYHGRGVDALLYRETLERAQKNGMKFGEASWVLENNLPMSRAAEAMQADPYKRYRVFEKTII